VIKAMLQGVHAAQKGGGSQLMCRWVTSWADWWSHQWLPS
jgi:hypothetical protein